jgi:hypothetical protein
MRKKIILFTIISLSIFLVGCNNKQTDSTENTKPNVEQASDNSDKKEDTNTQTETMYSVKSDTYKQGNITIAYPEISGLKDTDKQTKINQLIKTRALSTTKDNSWGDELTLDIKYKITLQNKELLSIQYSGLSNVEKSAHPNNEFYTSNIDILNAKELTLSDFVTINSDFIKSFKSSTYIPWMTFDSKDEEKNIISALDEYKNTQFNDNDLLNWFKHSDNTDTNANISGVFCYLTNDSLGIGIYVPHVSGDHAEYEMKLNKIKNNLKTDNKAFKALLDSSK